MKKIKVFMNKFDGEIGLSFYPKALWFQDDSTGQWCNAYILIGYL